jgi:hypothetical protein
VSARVTFTAPQISPWPKKKKHNTIRHRRHFNTNTTIIVGNSSELDLLPGIDITNVTNLVLSFEGNVSFDTTNGEWRRFAYKAVRLQIVKNNREEMKRKVVSQGLLLLRQSNRFAVKRQTPSVCV